MGFFRKVYRAVGTLGCGLGGALVGGALGGPGGVLIGGCAGAVMGYTGTRPLTPQEKAARQAFLNKRRGELPTPAQKAHVMWWRWWQNNPANPASPQYYYYHKKHRPHPMHRPHHR